MTNLVDIPGTSKMFRNKSSRNRSTGSRRLAYVCFIFLMLSAEVTESTVEFIHIGKCGGSTVKVGFINTLYFNFNPLQLNLMCSYLSWTKVTKLWRACRQLHANSQTHTHTHTHIACISLRRSGSPLTCIFLNIWGVSLSFRHGWRCTTLNILKRT